MSRSMPRLVLFNKPFGVLSQFRIDDNNEFATLSDFFTDKSLRVAGRLDATSEGLLLLTDDGQVNKALTNPPKANHGRKQGKTYWVQLDGNASDEQIEQLRQGVLLKDGLTLPALVERLTEEQIAKLWQAPDGVAKRKITSWLSITIFEGKNRQVRRMTAHVGLPCLRLVRVASSGFELNELKVGEAKELVLSELDLKRLGICNTVVSGKQSPHARPSKSASPKPLKLAYKSPKKPVQKLFAASSKKPR